jgi:hypothetical protein
VDVIVSRALPLREVLDRICAQIRVDAAESGDFVEQIRVAIPQCRVDGRRTWSAFYLTGPPGLFPETATISGVDGFRLLPPPAIHTECIAPRCTEVSKRNDIGRGGDKI